MINLKEKVSEATEEVLANSPIATIDIATIRSKKQSEAAVQWYSAKKVFQQISQISRENNCSKDLILMKLQVYRV